MLDPEEVTARDLPSGAYQVGPDGKISQVGDRGTNVTLNNQGETKFAAETGKLPVQEAADIATAGMQAQRNLTRIGDLERTLSNAPKGGRAV
ncbi:MAG: hypothetical protein AAF982_03855 [Pseudomonadota bacterium]